MDRCIHELETFSCADCRPRTVAGQIVYATPGGSVVHRRPDCEMLARGQASVDSAGGRIGVINPVHRDKHPGRGRTRNRIMPNSYKRGTYRRHHHKHASTWVWPLSLFSSIQGSRRKSGRGTDEEKAVYGPADKE